VSEAAGRELVQSFSVAELVPQLVLSVSVAELLNYLAVVGVTAGTVELVVEGQV